MSNYFHQSPSFEHIIKLVLPAAQFEFSFTVYTKSFKNHRQNCCDSLYYHLQEKKTSVMNCFYTKKKKQRIFLHLYLHIGKFQTL